MNEKNHLRDNLLSKFQNLKSKLFKREDGNYEKTLKIIMSVSAVLLLVLAVNIKTRALSVSLNGKSLGIVRREEDIDLALKSLKEELKSTYHMDIILNEELELEKTHARDKNIINRADLTKELKERMNFLVEGYDLKVNGQSVATLKTEEEIKEVLEDLKKPYIEEEYKNEKSREVTVLEDIEISKTEVPVYKIGNKDTLTRILTTGGEEIKTHTVEVGESLWTIAKIYGTTVDDLIEANKDRDPEKLQIGDEVRLVESKPLLTICSVSEVEYEKEIDYEKEVEEVSSMYNDEKKTKVEGVKGKSKVVAKEIRHNGVLVDTELLKEDLVSEPVTEVVMKGTKERPKTDATGTFIMPTRGRISSRYGMRNGRMHKGLDIASGTGTPIKAADGGKVVKVGWHGAYGKMVEIDHGNGYRTKYAHCSSILVKQGEKVYKGQHIANVGNTGRSTGSHLHLEVIKNGKNQNPSQYVK